MAIKLTLTVGDERLGRIVGDKRTNPKQDILGQPYNATAIKATLYLPDGYFVAVSQDVYDEYQVTVEAASGQDEGRTKGQGKRRGRKAESGAGPESTEKADG